MTRKAKTGGRQKGTPNRFTSAMRDAFRQAFDDLGGVPQLVEWAKENRTDFYKLAASLSRRRSKRPEMDWGRLLSRSSTTVRVRNPLTPMAYTGVDDWCFMAKPAHRAAYGPRRRVRPIVWQSAERDDVMPTAARRLSVTPRVCIRPGCALDLAWPGLTAPPAQAHPFGSQRRRDYLQTFPWCQEVHFLLD